MFWQLQLRNIKGHKAEALALSYLKRQGLKLIQKNYACRFGELDLIMLDEDTLVFIEVRFRTQSGFGRAEESITASKRKKLHTTASHFLQRFPCHQHRFCRFDVVTLNAAKSNDDEPQQKTIEWLKGAFQ